ncbi:hypothetical protein Tco_1263826 [Tanacetum coccineum]
MVNKDNYVPWSSRLLCYEKSKPNGKLIYKSIMNGPYVRGMIPEPGYPDREVLVAETFHEQTDDELTEKEVKQMEADDQAIQIILVGLPEDIYDVAKVNELRAERLARAHDPLALMASRLDSQNVGNLNGYNAIQNVRNLVIQNAAQNLGVQNVGNQNRLIVVSGITNPNANQIGNGNVVAARAEGNANRNNGDLEEIKEVNANCILMANLQHTSTLEEQYNDLLEPILEPHKIQQNDSNVISAVSIVEQSGGTVEQNPATVEETHTYFESLYNNFIDPT